MVAGGVDEEASRAASVEASLATAISTEASSARAAESSLTTALGNEVTRATAAENAVATRASSIEALIPAEATTGNQLADKAFVNSSIGTSTSNYISNNGQPFTSYADLVAYTGTVTNNDYAFVTGEESGNAYYDRYKASVSGNVVTWAKEYRLNNSSFTAEQWAAINSGITDTLVGKITANETAISTEASRAASVEASLVTAVGGASGDVASEVTRATAAESSLATAISSEATRAASAEASIQSAASSALSAEASTARAAESSLASAVAAEASRAASAEANIEWANVKNKVNATTTAAGLVNTGAQIFAGDKTFNNNVILGNATLSYTSTGLVISFPD